MITKIKDGINLWTKRGKIGKSMKIVRPVDLNKVIDEANADISANTSAISANTSAITALGGQWSYTEVSVTGQQIQNMGSSPVPILPALNGGEYYQYDGVVEYTHNTQAFSVVGIGFITITDGWDTHQIGSSMLQNTSNSVAEFASKNPTGAVDADGVTFKYPVNVTFPGPLQLTTFNSVDPTAGNGSILIKLWYRVRTIGTEL